LWRCRPTPQKEEKPISLFKWLLYVSYLTKPSSGSSTNTCVVNWMPNMDPSLTVIYCTRVHAMKLKITTNVFVELPDDGHVRTETCSNY
jgi:hypothetical protein